MNEVNVILDNTVTRYGNLDIALVPWINPENEAETTKFLQNCKWT